MAIYLIGGVVLFLIILFTWAGIRAPQEIKPTLPSASPSMDILTRTRMTLEKNKREKDLHQAAQAVLKEIKDKNLDNLLLSADRLEAALKASQEELS